MDGGMGEGKERVGKREVDHFVDVTEMVEIGSGAQRKLQTVMMSRYACYLVIQNADPSKEIVAKGQDKLLREKINGDDKANQAHREVGAKVRQGVIFSGGWIRIRRAKLSRRGAHAPSRVPKRAPAVRPPFAPCAPMPSQRTG